MPKIFRKYARWYIKPELKQRFTEECKASKLKPNICLELLLEYWHKEMLPKLKARMVE